MKLGFKVQRIREIKGVKQAALAKLLNITQQRLSQIEQSDTIDEEMLSVIAKALNTSAEIIKEFNDSAINNFNHFATNGYAINYQIVMTEKMVELYERIIAEKDAVIRKLEEKIISKN